MIKQLAALALAGSALLGCASSAVAGDRLPFNETKINNLLEVVKETGHRVYRGGGPCDRLPAYGFATPTRRLVICVDNHKGDLVELGDTIRHEAFHLAQFCKARRVGATAALIFPDRKGMMEEAIRLGMPVQHYQERQHATEAEARVIAHEMDADQIAVILEEECHHD